MRGSQDGATAAAIVPRPLPMEPPLPQAVPDSLRTEGPRQSREFGSEGSPWNYQQSDNEESGRSFVVENSDDLLNTPVTRALSSDGMLKHKSITSASGVLQQVGGPVDWSTHKNVDRLATVRNMIRNLFWALQAELESERTCRMDPSKSEAPQRRSVPSSVTKFVRHDYFALFFLVLTLYALFGPDLCACFGHTALNRDNYTLAVINTFVLVMFMLETLFNSIVFPGFVCSLRFWIDMLATFSIAGDSLLGTEFLQSDAFVAMRGSRLTKVLRVGGRSSKFVRFLRATRSLQLLRFIPKLNDWLNRGLNELAASLWLKRVQRVFMFLDGGTGFLQETDVHFFNTAMQIEFAEGEAKTPWITRMVERLRPTKPLRLGVTLAGPLPFAELAQDFMATVPGKRSFQRCKEDIQSMKESCAIVEQASDRLTLKVCILVLMLLLTMQLLMTAAEDTSRVQGLHQVDAVAMNSETSPSEFCSFVKREYARVARDATFLMLIANYRVFWQPDCHCCSPDVIAARPPLSLDSRVRELDVIEQLVKGTGLEDHEILVEAITDSSGLVRSLVVFDNHISERSLAVNSLMQTIVVVALLTSLVLYFATDMRKLASQSMLHPLWNLMDDMCSMKNIDVLVSGQQGVIADDALRGLQRRLSSSVSRLAGLYQCKRPAAIADELLRLRHAFDKLQLAMQSWSKFVPLILLKQLFQANIEASIGCTFSEVCVFFTAIDDFENVCENLTAKEVLELMSGVLSAIYDALDSNSGTMLEFIGDEVLAVFNAPARVPAYETSAISAALEAQDLVGKLGHSNVLLNSSVHKARVLAGNLGSPTRMKYGVLGDGVNLAARLKSLNTRYDTHLLVSSDALMFKRSQETFLVRPVGDLILKGRNTPTRTFEVMGRSASVSLRQRSCAEKHTEAFALFKRKSFADAKRLFQEVHDGMRQTGGNSGAGDKVSEHFVGLCEQFMETPPPEGWDGSERLQKKAF